MSSTSSRLRKIPPATAKAVCWWRRTSCSKASLSSAWARRTSSGSSGTPEGRAGLALTPAAAATAGDSDFGTCAMASRLRLAFHSFPQPHHLFHSVTGTFVLAHILSIWNNTCMIIGDRLRALREEKKLSQGDIEKRTGLLRCYISRLENGHTVPAIETLDKRARAPKCPSYQLFYDGDEPPPLPNLLELKSSDELAWGHAGKDAPDFNKLRSLMGA